MQEDEKVAEMAGTGKQKKGVGERGGHQIAGWEGKP